MILNKKIHWLWLLGFIIIILYIVGCAAAPSGTPSPSTKVPRLPSEAEKLPAQAPTTAGVKLPSVILQTRNLELRPPSSHLWAPLKQVDHEKHGYGMYTYVLCNWNINDHPIDSETAERYKKLLKAITQTTNRISPKNLKYKNKKEVNLFCIPSKNNYNEGTFTLKNYNFDIAQCIINHFAKMIKNHKKMFKRVNGPGPILITIAHPIGTYTEGHFPLLYVDLSKSNPDAILQTIIIYKNYIRSKNIDTEEELQSIKIKLLNDILDANRYLLIEFAYAKGMIL